MRNASSQLLVGIVFFVALLVLPSRRSSIYALLGNNPLVQAFAALIISIILANALAETRRRFFIWFGFLMAICSLNILAEHVF